MDFNTKEIKVTIGADGGAQVEFGGFVGKACLNASDELKARLRERGIEVETSHITPKPEYDLDNFISADTAATNATTVDQFGNPQALDLGTG